MSLLCNGENEKYRGIKGEDFFNIRPSSWSIVGAVATAFPNCAVSVQLVKNEYKEDYIPAQIIQREDSKTTILVWKDGSKTIVHCSPDEEFIPEFGVAMATMNKIYGNRNKFKKFLDKKVFWQDKAKKVKKEEPTLEENLQDFSDRLNELASI